MPSWQSFWHGIITAPGLTTTNSDSFLSTDSSSTAFFGDLSVAIHSMNATGVTCANVKMPSASDGTSTIGTSATPTQSTSPCTDVAKKANVRGAAAGLAAGLSFFLQERSILLMAQARDGR